MTEYETQNQRVLDYLRRHGSMTLADALNLRPPITRLAARISNLREQGHDIVNTQPGNRPAVYRLAAPAVLWSEGELREAWGK